VTTERLEADVVVVGSGAGGAAVSGKLIRNGCDVIMLEAGPRRGNAPEHARNVDPTEDGLGAFGAFLEANLSVQSQAEAAPDRLPGLKVLHGVGGMLTGWTNACPPPDRTELSPAIPAADWDRHLAESRAALRVDTGLEDGVRAKRIRGAVSEILGERAPGREVMPMPLAGTRQPDGSVRWSATDTLLDASEEARARLIVLPDFVVRDVEVEDGHATGVTAWSREGERCVEVRAAAVVIAGGTIGSAQLIHASQLDAGPALGRYVHEHPTFLSRVRLKDELVADVPADDPPFSILSPYSIRHPWQHSVIRLPNGFSPDVEAGPKLTADVACYTPVQPREENRVRFDDDQLDPFGLPVVEADYSFGRVDRERLSGAIAEHVLIASGIGSFERGWSPVLFPAGSNFHLQGTCRMGVADDGTSVVDSNGRLWNYDNIFVAGNAVHAVPNAGNPTIVTVATSLRCADEVLRLTTDRPSTPHTLESV
jgi:choline dehydrogenase-like flavoprotein